MHYSDTYHGSYRSILIFIVIIIMQSLSMTMTYSDDVGARVAFPRTDAGSVYHILQHIYLQPPRYHPRAAESIPFSGVASFPLLLVPTDRSRASISMPSTVDLIFGLASCWPGGRRNTARVPVIFSHHRLSINLLHLTPSRFATFREVFPLT